MLISTSFILGGAEDVTLRRISTDSLALQVPYLYMMSLLLGVFQSINNLYVFDGECIQDNAGLGLAIKLEFQNFVFRKLKSQVSLLTFGQK